MNPMNQIDGPANAVGFHDNRAVLAVATPKRGRIVAFSDWDTFANGSHPGININEKDNLTLVLNALTWLQE